MNHKSDYIRMRTNQIERVLRLYFGIKQMYRPHCIIVLIFLGASFLISWKYRYLLYQLVQRPKILELLWQSSISIIVIVLFSSCLLLFIEKTGEILARNDEAKLYVAFRASDLKGQSPILISRKRMKDVPNVTVREFYTQIPKKRWEEMQEEIADCMNVTFVAPYIEYGGKHRNKGNRIIIYSVPNRKFKKRGVLYDEKL